MNTPMPDKWNYSCTFCQGSGWVVAVHRERGSPFSFRCKCKAAEKLSPKVPQWSETRRKAFKADYDDRPVPIAVAVKHGGFIEKSIPKGDAE